MADLTIREKFFDDLAKGARWDVGVSIARGNPLPLDANSVFESYEDLETYAAGVLAYPGQVVAVVTENSTGIYYLDQEKAIQPVGVIPTGDGVSVEMDENDVISLRDFGKAFYKYIPAEGEVAAHYEKVEVSEENPWVAGLEPKVTAEGLGWYEPNPTTVDGVNSQVTALAGRVTEAEADIAEIEKDYLKAADKKELADAIAAEAERADEAEKANAAAIKAIADDYLKTEDKYDDTALVNRVATIEGDYLKAADIANMATDAEVESAVKAEADRAKGVEEGLQNQINLIMNNPDTENVINSITEFTKYIDDHGEIAEGFRTDIDANADAIADEIARAEAAEGLLAGRLDTLETIDHDAYVAADTALREALEAEIAKKADATQVATDIAAALVTAAEDATAKANKAKEDAIADADAKLADKANAADVYAKTETYTKAEADKAIEEALSKATGGESAADVLVALDNYKKFMNTEVFGNEAGTGDSRIDTAETKLAGIAEGAQVNVIESVVAKAGAKVTATTEGKTVTIDDAALQTLISETKSQADKGVTDAAAAMAKAEENATAIGSHGTRLTTVETLINGDGADIKGLLTDVADLKAHDTSHAAEFNSLSGAVNTNSGDIATLKTGKADVSALNAVDAKVETNKQDIATLKDTTIPAINAEIAKKADATALNNYFTKEQIGTIAEGKTIVEMIADAQTAATYDDTAVKKLISDEADRAKAAESAIAGDVATNALAIAANASEISRIDGVLATVFENEDGTALNSFKELADWITKHGTDAAEMVGSISKNAEDIAANGVLIKANTDAIAAINHAETGILAQAKAHAESVAVAAVAGIPVATQEVLGLVKFDNTTVKMNASNQLYVAEVSTDILKNGNQTLVLNGGSAAE